MSWRSARVPLSPAALFVLFSLVLTLMVIGCTSTHVNYTLANEFKASPTSEENVRIFGVDERPDLDCEVLGRVSVKKKSTVFTKPGDESMRTSMRTVAARMGADAVIGYYFSIQTDDGNNAHRPWASGLAVKYNQADNSDPQERQPFVVAIPPTLWSSSGDANQREQDLRLREEARFRLERKGFYSFLTEGEYRDYDKDLINSLGEDDFSLLFGRHADLVLILGPMEKNDDIEVAAELYSRSEREIIWSSRKSSSASFTEIMFGGTPPWINDIQKVAKKLLDGIPDAKSRSSRLK